MILIGGYGLLLGSIAVLLYWRRRWVRRHGTPGVPGLPPPYCDAPAEDAPWSCAAAIRAQIAEMRTACQARGIEPCLLVTLSVEAMSRLTAELGLPTGAELWMFAGWRVQPADAQDLPGFSWRVAHDPVRLRHLERLGQEDARDIGISSPVDHPFEPFAWYLSQEEAALHIIRRSPLDDEPPDDTACSLEEWNQKVTRLLDDLGAEDAS